MRYANGHGPAKLRWSRDGWLHKPSQVLVPDGDPRAPQTIAEAKTRHDWCLTGSQADVKDGHYRRDIILSTGQEDQPTYVATWHSRAESEIVLLRGTGAKAYKACVDHYQRHGTK